jgi:gluconate 2-dehydrogenase gamma chain
MPDPVLSDDHDDVLVDAPPSSLSQSVSLGAFDRRSALVAGSAVLVGLAAGGACQRDSAPSTSTTTPARDQADASPTDARAFVPVLAAIAARLVPADETGPGAAEAGVEAFFARALDDQRLAAVHPLLKRGCAFLMKAARVEQNRAFVDLDAAAQDDLLRRLVEGRMRPDGFSGPTFVRVALALTLEGFLGDPRHGGNKDAVGWRFAGYAPDGRAAGLAQPVPSLKVVP